MPRVTRLVDQNEVYRDIQERVAQPIVRSRFGKEDVADMKGYMLLGEATWTPHASVPF